MVLIKYSNVVVFVHVLVLIYAKQEESQNKQQQHRPDPIFSNEFAVHIPHGGETADLIAAKHGFINRGQVSTKNPFFLFYFNKLYEN